MNQTLAKRAIIDGKECRLVKGYGLAMFNLPGNNGVNGVEVAKAIEDDAGRIIDFQNVKGEGYITTWSEDETGETAVAEAFTKELIEEYFGNPVLMCDHGWGCYALAGGVTEAKPDMHGCKIKFNISNAPGMIDIRFKIAEGYLRTLSINGYASMDETTGKFTMLKWIESSLTPIPANRECQFDVVDGNPVRAGKSKAVDGATAKANQGGKPAAEPEKLAPASDPKPAPAASNSVFEIAQGLKLTL